MPIHNRAFLYLICLSFALTSCAQPAAAAQSTESSVLPEQTGIPGEIVDTAPAPTAESLPAYSLNEQPYVSPSNAFSMRLPANWNCSETGKYQVDCYSTDNSSKISARVISTGYELVREDFLNMVHAEMVSTYTDKKAYNELSQESDSGSFNFLSTWREGDAYWQGTDYFVQSGLALYIFSFASVQELFENYKPMFEEIIQNAELNSSTMSGAPLYFFRKNYTSPDQIFTLKIPTSWIYYSPVTISDRTTWEAYYSPDSRASVQVMIFRKGSAVSQEVKASKTLEILHDKYGYDLRVPKSEDQVLSDGRERLGWYVEKRNLNGVSYFDSVGTSLFIFNVVWEDATKDLYKPILDEVSDSFNYK